MLKKLVQDNPDIRLVYKHYALPKHARARPAAIAAVAAQRQDKFWEMHDVVFQNQRALDDASLRRYAQSIGLDMPQYDKDVADPAAGGFVDAEGLEAQRAGVTGTPNVFVNGVKAPTWDAGTLQKLIDTARSGGDIGKAAGTILAEMTQRQQAARRQSDETVYSIDITGSPFKGPADASVVVVAFSDYQ